MKAGRVHWGRPQAPLEAREPASPPLTPEALMLRRLAAAGLRAVTGMRLTNNRSVVVSFSRLRVLSVHRSCAQAPDSVVKAIVRFVAPGTPRATRKVAEREILSFHAGQVGDQPPAPRRRAERARPEDAPALERLGELFRAYNTWHRMAGKRPRTRCCTRWCTCGST